jgi:hypothetical protein
MGTLQVPIIKNLRQHLRLGILVTLLRAPIHRFVLDPRSADADTLHILAPIDAKREERARTAQVGRDVLALWEHCPAREPGLRRRPRQLGGVVHQVLARARVVEDGGAPDLRRVLGWAWEGDRGVRPGAWDTWGTREGRRELGTGGPAGPACVCVDVVTRLLPSQPAGELVPLHEIGDSNSGQPCTLCFQIQ